MFEGRLSNWADVWRRLTRLCNAKKSGPCHGGSPNRECFAEREWFAKSSEQTNITLRWRVVLFQRSATGRVKQSSHPRCSYAPQNVATNSPEPSPSPSYQSARNIMRIQVLPQVVLQPLMHKHLTLFTYPEACLSPKKHLPTLWF